MVGHYRKAGLKIVAVGLDTERGLAKSLARLAPGEALDYLCLSDRKLRLFREWLAYDDFEHMPLHGTYLIDANGRVRWHDIRPQPFVEPAWLLQEARRLLGEVQ